jgi:hypothetical protein
MSMRGWLTVVLSAAALAACEGSPNAASSFAVVFVVESDPGVRLNRAYVFADGKPMGETDSNGRVQAKIDGQLGQRLRIEHDCPDGHEAPSEPKILRLRRFEGIQASGPLAMEITLRCRPMKRLAAFVVRAKNGPELPVLLDGKSATRTNGSGVAHFSVWGVAGTEYMIELDTREHPRLLPRSPMHLFALPDADEIFVVNQSFDVEGESPRKRHRRTRITKIE